MREITIIGFFAAGNFRRKRDVDNVTIISGTDSGLHFFLVNDVAIGRWI